MNRPLPLASPGTVREGGRGGAGERPRFGRRLEAVRRFVWIAASDVFGGTPRPFATQIETPGGARKRAVMERVAAAFATTPADAWTFASVDVPASGFVFTRSDGRTLQVRLHRKTEKAAYADTTHFRVSYRFDGPLEERERAFLDRMIAQLRASEPALEGTDGFPHVILERVAAEVTVYPQNNCVELRPSLACNHHCGFCNSVDRSIDNVMQGAAELLGTIDAVAAQPVRSAVISGGEPTLLRDLPRAIDALADRGFSVELQTNGMALSDPAYAERLRGAGLRRALISLHSHDEALSDERITRFPGGWRKTVAGIDAALAHGIDVHLSHVVHADNRGGLRAFLELVKTRWGRKVRVRLAFVAPTGDAVENFDAQVPSLPDALPGIREGLAFAERHRLRLVLVGYCGIPPCLLLPHESFSDVCYAPAATFPDDHVKTDACRECVYVERCPGLWSEYFRRHGDPGLRPIRRGRHLPKLVRWWRYE